MLGTRINYDMLDYLPVREVARLKESIQQVDHVESAVVRFRSEGVEKLADVLGDDLDGLSARLNATVEVSRDYRSFSGLTDGMDGTVRFVYRTEAVEKAE